MNDVDFLQWVFNICAFVAIVCLWLRSSANRDSIDEICEEMEGLGDEIEGADEVIVALDRDLEVLETRFGCEGSRKEKLVKLH
jgi:hypothetical protein